MTRKRHHLLIRVLHWLIAFLILAALTMSALVMPHIPVDSPEMVASLRRHMSTGLLVFFLTLLRFVMRRNSKRPPALSSGMAWADGLARIVHLLFDVLVLTMISSGIGMALLGGLFPVVFAGSGHLPESLDTLPLLAIHRYAAIALFLIFILHVGGALFHQIILRDGLLSRMGFDASWYRTWRSQKTTKTLVPGNGDAGR